MKNIKTRCFSRSWVVAHPWMATFAAIVALVLFIVTQIAMNHNRYLRVKQWFVGEMTEATHE